MTMWEWRIFYPETNVPKWVSNVNEILHTIPTEERLDLYYNLYSHKFGLKIRALSENYQLLELKLLLDVNEDYELWDKPIKQTIQLIENESLIHSVTSCLKKSTQFTDEINKILAILSAGKYSEILITKHRKKFSFNDISVESVAIEYQNKKQLGVQLECNSILKLNKFIHKTLAIPSRKYSNTSYPRFLLKL
jgi:hypothetical protein